MQEFWSSKDPRHGLEAWTQALSRHLSFQGEEMMQARGEQASLVLCSAEAPTNGSFPFVTGDSQLCNKSIHVPTRYVISYTSDICVK